MFAPDADDRHLHVRYMQAESLADDDKQAGYYFVCLQCVSYHCGYNNTVGNAAASGATLQLTLTLYGPMHVSLTASDV